MNEQRTPVLEAIGLVKTFEDVGRKIEVLRGIELVVGRGDRVAIIGASGSGKTTLLQLLGGLDEPTGGDVRVGGQSMTHASDGTFAANDRQRSKACPEPTNSARSAASRAMKAQSSGRCAS